MLAEGQYNISEIAQCCGFSSIYVFSKLFKQEYAHQPQLLYGRAVPECETGGGGFRIITWTSRFTIINDHFLYGFRHT